MADTILQQVAANRQTAMDECLARYGGLVWKIVLRRCHNRADAEDVVQDVFLDLWKSAHRYDPAVAEESTFIAMITRRRLIDRTRRLGRTPDTAPLSELGEPAFNGKPAADICDEAAHVRRAMQDLSLDERQVIELAVDKGMTQAEIAAQTNLPIGTVKSHARRGMMRLRSLLGVKSHAVEGGVR